MSTKLLRYEIRNIKGNIFAIFFGIVFPIIMSLIISKVHLNQVPDVAKEYAMTNVFLTMSMMVPLALIIICYGSNYALELEKEIPIRMTLFGFKERQLFISKFFAYLIFTIFSVLIYVVADILILDLQKPNIYMLLIYIVTMLIMSLLFFMIAHGIAMFCSKYGSAFATCMFVYFGIMILCGMMGITVEQLPSSIKKIAYLLPMSYVSSEFVDSWSKGGYNCRSLIFSFLFLFVVASIILTVGLCRYKRRNK